MRAPRAMVLCAGFGTRLRPLSDERPKPLVPVGDRTLLEHVLDRLELAELTPALVNCHHLPDIFQAITVTCERVSRVLLEPRILGTAGGVAAARVHFAAGPVLVTNADVLSAFDGQRLLEAVADDALCLAVAPRAAGSGSVGIGDGGRVVRLRGERFGDELRGGDYVGTMAIGSKALGRLPDTGCLIGDVALPLLRAGVPVGTQEVTGSWSAPGDGIEHYLAANLRWLAERRPPGGSFVAESAQVSAQVELVSSLVGDGAVVAGSGRLERVVVWPNARVQAPLADAVVTSRGIVVRRPSG